MILPGAPLPEALMYTSREALDRRRTLRHRRQAGAGAVALRHHRPRVHGGGQVHVAGAVHGEHLEGVQPHGKAVQGQLVLHHLLDGAAVQHVPVGAGQLVAAEDEARGARARRLPGGVRLEEGVGGAHVHHKLAHRLVADQVRRVRGPHREGVLALHEVVELDEEGVVRAPEAGHDGVPRGAVARVAQLVLRAHWVHQQVGDGAVDADVGGLRPHRAGQRGDGGGVVQRHRRHRGGRVRPPLGGQRPHLHAVHALREVLELEGVLVLHAVPVSLVQLVLEGELLSGDAVHQGGDVKLHRVRRLEGSGELGIDGLHKEGALDGVAGVAQGVDREHLERVVAPARHRHGESAAGEGGVAGA
mmetsp:Transcript_22007/g.48290  ORF Transcript_22007/g.48290 Transcript_22007/m.48290 type:complete len:359 (-) Transcript_22007:1321-2397(-)